MHQNITSAAVTLISNLTELACLQRVIEKQLIHRQPTERKVLIILDIYGSKLSRKKESKVPYVRVFNSYIMNQLIRTPTYLGASLVPSLFIARGKEAGHETIWSHMYQGIRKEPIMNGSEIELQVTSPMLQYHAASNK